MPHIIQWHAGPDPMFGPPRPHFCTDGFESHDWTLTVEEGQLTLVSGCTLCDQGIFECFASEEFEIQTAITCRLKQWVEGGGDMTYVWVEIVPTAITHD